MSEEVTKEDPLVTESNACIVEVLKEMRTFLSAKNKDYQASAFRDASFGGKVITAEDTITVRICDKLKRLQSSELTFESSADSCKDLAGYLIIQMALEKLRAKK
jgi:hypothetical protein